MERKNEHVLEFFPACGLVVWFQQYSKVMCHFGHLAMPIYHCPDLALTVLLDSINISIIRYSHWIMEKYDLIHYPGLKNKYGLKAPMDPCSFLWGKCRIDAIAEPDVHIHSSASLVAPSRGNAQPTRCTMN